MAAQNDTASMALFCDFENIALGVRDAQYEKFDIRPVLERLLAKGSIVVKKAYCDWDRYKGFKSAMHEANFELIEIPHVRQSGKNSADIRMVVDALDLCYTKAHVDTFVIISGDSDFSPLVSKLRENAKKVIGVGVKQSCSDLLVTNCDEFIYYDDLVREREGGRTAQRREREKRSPEEEARRREKFEERKNKGIEIVADTFVDLIADRGESERIWASVLKEVVRRRHPGFNESYYGFRSFGNLLEEAAARGLLGFGRDDKGAFVFRAPIKSVVTETEVVESPAQAVEAIITVDLTEAAKMPEAASEPAASPDVSSANKTNGRRRGRGRKSEVEAANQAAPVEEAQAPAPLSQPEASAAPVVPPASELPAVQEATQETEPTPASEPPTLTETKKPRRRNTGRSRKASEPTLPEAQPPAPVVIEAELPAVEASAAEPAAKKKAPRRRKPKAASEA